MNIIYKFRILISAVIGIVAGLVLVNLVYAGEIDYHINNVEALKEEIVEYEKIQEGLIQAIEQRKAQLEKEVEIVESLKKMGKE